jgi:predicted RecA/RadA family phage recombinase
MNNFVQPGDIIDLIPPAAVTSGQVVVVGSMLAVACADIAAGALGAGAIEGVFDLPKKAGGAVAVGAKLTWSITDHAFTADAGTAGDIVGGAVAVDPAAADATVVRVKLAPGAGTVAA